MGVNLLEQSCQTGGPRAESGPRRFRKWPARDPHILVIQAYSQIDSKCMQMFHQNRPTSMTKSKILRTSCAHVHISTMFHIASPVKFSLLLDTSIGGSNGCALDARTPPLGVPEGAPVYYLLRCGQNSSNLMPNSKFLRLRRNIMSYPWDFLTLACRNCTNLGVGGQEDYQHGLLKRKSLIYDGNLVLVHHPSSVSGSTTGLFILTLNGKLLS